MKLSKLLNYLRKVIQNPNEINLECVKENQIEISTNNDAIPTDYTGHTYDEVINLIGFGRVQKSIMTTCALMILMCMNELFGISVITIAAQCDLKMDNTRKGIVHASMLWGKILSAIFLGHLSDRVGRRTVLIYTTLLANLFSLCAMLMPNFWAFVYFRFFMGICTGGTVGISLTYLAEFLTPNQRPFLMNYVNISNGVSFVYISVSTYLLLEMKWSYSLGENFQFRPWRLLIFFNILPGFIAVLMITQYPESPKLLLALGKCDEAYKVADWICRKNHDGRSLKDFQIYSFSNETNIKMVQPLNCTTWKLFKPPYVWYFLICIIVLMGSQSIYYGLGLWYPVILNDMFYFGERSIARTMCSVIMEIEIKDTLDNKCDDIIAEKSLFEDFAYGAISIVAYIFLGMIISTNHRKWILICLLSISGLCGWALIKLTNSTAIICIFSFHLVFADLSSSTLLGYMTDLVPTESCAQATCIATTFGRLSGSFATYSIGIYLQSYCYEDFLFFAIIALVGAVMTCFLPQKLVVNNTNV